MIAKEIANYIANRITGFVVGSNLFVGEFPKEDEEGKATEDGVYLVSVAGDGQDKYLDTLYESIDFWSVSPHTTTAYEALESIRTLLSRNSNYQAGNFLIYFSHDISGIMDLDRTRDNLKIYKMTLRFIFRDTNVIS